MEVFSFRIQNAPKKSTSPWLQDMKKIFSSSIPWKMIQRQTTRKLLGQVIKSEKLQKLELEFFLLLFPSDSYSLFLIYTGNLKVAPEKKSPSPKVLVSTQNLNLT